MTGVMLPDGTTAQQVNPVDPTTGATINPVSVLGTTTDAADTAGANNKTISARFRGLIQILTDVWDGTNHLLKAGLQAGENHVGEVGGNSDQISPSLAVTIGSAYAAGNVVGGLLTLTGALRGSPNARFTGILQSVLIIDRANQKPALDILIFNAAPAGTYTDKSAAPTMTQADLNKLIRRVSITASDYVTVGGAAIADISAIAKIVKGVTADLSAVCVLTSGTPTFVATTDLVARFGFLRD